MALPRARLDRVRRLAQQRSERHALLARGATRCRGTTVGKHLLDEVHGAFESLQHVLEGSVAFRARVCARGVLRMHLQRRERCPQLVRRVGSEAPLAGERIAHAREQSVQSLDQRCDLGRDAREHERCDRVGLAARDLPRERRQRGEAGAEEETRQQEQQRDAGEERGCGGEGELLREFVAHVVPLRDLDPHVAGAEREHAPVLPREGTRGEAGGQGREGCLWRRRRAHEQAPGGVAHLEGDLGLVVVAERARPIVGLVLERPWQRDDDGRGYRCLVYLPRDQRLEHARGSGESRIEEFLSLFLAAGEAQPCGGAEHQDQSGAGTGEQQRKYRARPAVVLHGDGADAAGDQSVRTCGAGSMT